jgi:hypothetical protein
LKWIIARDEACQKAVVDWFCLLVLELDFGAIDGSVDETVPVNHIKLAFDFQLENQLAFY